MFGESVVNYTSESISVFWLTDGSYKILLWEMTEPVIVSQAVDWLSVTGGHGEEQTEEHHRHQKHHQGQLGGGCDSSGVIALNLYPPPVQVPVLVVVLLNSNLAILSSGQERLWQNKYFRIEWKCLYSN